MSTAEAQDVVRSRSGAGKVGAGVLLTILGALVGAVAGQWISLTFNFHPGVPVAVGWILGVMVAGHGRPDSFEEWLGRGTLALGLALLTGWLFDHGNYLPAWFAAVGALSVASILPRKGIAPIVLRASICAATVGLAFMVAHHTVGWAAEASWARGVLLSALVGLGAFFAAWLPVDRTPADEAAAEEKRRQKKDKAARKKKPPKTKQKSMPTKGDEPLVAETLALPPAESEQFFSQQYEALVDGAQRVETVLVSLAGQVPDEKEFATSVRERVHSMMDQARQSVNRWHSAGATIEAERIAEVRQSLETNQDLLLATEDGGMRRELELAIERQSRMLQMLEAMARGRETFGLKLSQVLSGLELLEVTLKQALTMGGSIDSSEIDALVDVMNDLDPSADIALAESNARLERLGDGEQPESEGAAEAVESAGEDGA